MFILLSITSIFSFMFIILLVATATLDGLPPYRTVLNCFHLFWTIVLIYFELFWYILLGWFYRLIIVLTFKLFTFKLLTLFTILLCFRLFPSIVRPLPPLWHGIVPLCVKFYSFLVLEGLSLCSQNDWLVRSCYSTEKWRLANIL